jgi:Domain of unknown function (DUF5122) beta-propeller
LLASRFAVTGGARDNNFGNAGTADITVSDTALEPAALLLQPLRRGRTEQTRRPARLLIAAHRAVPDVDSDHIPLLISLDQNTGQPVTTEGFGGAIHAQTGYPALVEGDGSVLVTVRPKPTPFTLPPPPTDPLQIRRINPDGTLGDLINLTVGFPAGINRLTRLPSGSLLVSGGSLVHGGWIARLTPAGVLDTTFGTNGVATPKPGNSDTALVLGHRTDGTLSVQVSSGSNVELCQLTTDGQLIPTYGTAGTGGFIHIDGFTHLLPGSGATGTWPTCYLDEDDQIIVVLTSSHDPSSFGAPVQVALRRIRTDGTYDKKFGIGVPRLRTPPADYVTALFAPTSTTGANSPDYAYLTFAGITWLSKTLYVIATGYAGGGMIGGYLAITKPIYPLLVITTWTREGKADRATLPGGYQEGGTNPFQYWYAIGVQKEATKSLLIFGGGGTPYDKTITLPDGTTHTETLVRQPGPAIFRVKQPNGLDMAFGDHGAAVIRVPELGPSVLAGHLSATKDRATLAFADLLNYQRGPLRTTYGGVVRFS